MSVGDIDLITKGLRHLIIGIARLQCCVGDIDLITKGLRRRIIVHKKKLHPCWRH